MADLSNITPGLTGSAGILVGPEHTAPRIGSGRVHVLATPVMINMMEAAALAAVRDNVLLIDPKYRVVYANDLASESLQGIEDQLREGFGVEADEVVGGSIHRFAKDKRKAERVLRDPDALRASFEWYRAIDTTMAQDAERAKTPLTMPVLAIGGERSFGEHVAEAMRPVADDVQGLVIAGAGHFVAEEAPAALLSALSAFLAPVAA